MKAIQSNDGTHRIRNDIRGIASKCYPRGVDHDYAAFTARQCGDNRALLRVDERRTVRASRRADAIPVDLARGVERRPGAGRADNAYGCGCTVVYLSARFQDPARSDPS